MSIPVACSWNGKLLMEKLPYKLTEIFRENMGEEMLFLTCSLFLTVFCVLGHHRLQEAKNCSMSPGSISLLLTLGEGSPRFPQNV